MAEGKSSRDRLKLSKFKLDALLDITKSINANLPVPELLKKYETILTDDLGIGKVCMLMKSGEWECLLESGFTHGYSKTINIEAQLLHHEDIRFVSDEKMFEGVDIVIPVYNNNVPQAFVLIGDIEEEGEGMSPVIKHLHFIQTISSIIIVAIENIRLFKESLRQEALKKELELAARMQTMLIPSAEDLPDTPKIHVSGFYYPHYEVGGDYYDCIRLSADTVGICMADVSGKGISAALLMSNFQASLRALFTTEISLDRLVHKLNSIIAINAAGEKFITLFIARYNSTSGVLEYVNAAHNPPVLIDIKSGDVSLLKAGCLGLGMLDEIPYVPLNSLRLTERNKLIMYTDGLSELKDLDGVETGTTAITANFSNKKRIDENIKALIAELGIPDENPNLFDDVSILASDLNPKG